MASKVVGRLAGSPPETAFFFPDGSSSTVGDVYHDMQYFSDNYRSAKEAKVVVFDKEQVEVFLRLIESNNFLPSTDYRLPFQDVWLSLTDSIRIHAYDGEYDVVAFLLTQIAVDESAYYATADLVRSVDSEIGAETRFAPVDWSVSKTVTFNQVRSITKDLSSDVVLWTSQTQTIVTSDECDPLVMAWKEKMRLLAAACIQYINCENVYLEKQGEVPESVNRKREAKGKSRLEPYYVCRIKGVQYDSHATGEGSKHGIRYDVRGHFRRLETGKTIWVRPHQRGLTNELYVPKVYQVNKGAKPKATI